MTPDLIARLPREGSEMTALKRTINARVRRGVRLLDAKVPQWRNAFWAVPKEAFNINDIEFCVLGHLSKAVVDRTLRVRIPSDISSYAKKGEDWRLGRELLGIGYCHAEEGEAWQYGFDFEPGDDDTKQVKPLLQSLWEKEIWGE